MNRGISSKETHDTVIRFAPPLIIEKSDIDWAMEQIIQQFPLEPTGLEITMPLN